MTLRPVPVHFRRATRAIIGAAREELDASSLPMTVRQVYYRLVARAIVTNSRASYQAVSDALVNARRGGLIPWEWIEDRLRRPRRVSMWADVADFAQVAEQYRRDVWATQPRTVEVWLEKDALSGLVEDALRPYGVTLNVGRGYDGWDPIHAAAARLSDKAEILYFGDFDPSGADMPRSLRERLADCGAHPTVTVCALRREDIARYRLPPDFTKATDSRRAAFVAKHGDVAVELDALPADVLRARIVEAVESRMDLRALRAIERRSARERRAIERALHAVRVR